MHEEHDDTEALTMRDEPKVRPILFSGEMVRAILAGHKTQTRRIIKPQPPVRIPCPYGIPGDRLWVRETWCRTKAGVHYRADCRSLDDEAAVGGRWKASIHLPRADSRLTLAVVAVRAERLGDITEADALAEGVAPLFRGVTRCDGEARDTYRWLWNKLNGPGSWDANPWVWVVEFRRLDSPIVRAAT